MVAYRLGRPGATSTRRQATPWLSRNEERKLSASPLVARRVFARLGDQLTKQDQRFVLVYGIEDATVTRGRNGWEQARRLRAPGRKRDHKPPRLYRAVAVVPPTARKCRTGRLGRATNGPVKTAPAFRHDQMRGPE